MYDQISYVVAGNPNTPTRVLERLARTGDRLVRRHVAENENSPLELLEKLAADLDPEVKVAALSNKNGPRFAVGSILESGDLQVLLLLADENWLPEEVLWTLVEDSNPYVAKQAVRTVNRKFFERRKWKD
ncbi:MAG: hypothetical protein K8F91_12320 [Candidatus Obscuribacterales bacterium]|nr:hypothetical protein [Candidatus Obscuribacterales bacterium]